MTNHRLVLLVLAAIVVVLGLAIGLTSADARRPRPELKYAIVECPSWPWESARDIDVNLRQVRKVVRGKRLMVMFQLRLRGISVAMQAIKIGTNPQTSRPVWSVRGPKALGAALTTAGCTVTQYKDVLALPAAQRDWILARSTCIGTATRSGKPLTVWPCGAASVVEARIDGVAPRVLYGGNARSVAGLSVP